jgi:AraC-like DNA-binding protein/quercetin dioxygenase-like cupin family protein
MNRKKIDTYPRESEEKYIIRKVDEGESSLVSNSLSIKEYKLNAPSGYNILIELIGIASSLYHGTSQFHRDDHYQFLFASQGKFHFQIDFKDVEMSAPFILCIEPKEVHRTVKLDNAKAFVLGIEPAFLDEEYQAFFGRKDCKLLKPISTNDISFKTVETILNTAYQLQNNKNSIYISRSLFLLINSIFCLLIDTYRKNSHKESPVSGEKRAVTIERKFNILLKQYYVHFKKPSQYAEKLSITTSHLNDSVKEISGKSVSENIQQYNITEAKRLLYFTDLEIREIAFRIGYEDAVYFGKLFKKLTQLTPLEFRNKFRD